MRGAASPPGAILPLGGHKGFGIGLLVEIMAGVLADSSFGTTEHSASELTGWDRLAKGASFVVLDVSRFLPLDAFRAHVDALVDDVHASELAPGTERILVPGELEAERRIAARAADVARLQKRWLAEAGEPRRGSGPRRLIELLPSHPIVDVRTATDLLGGTPERSRQAIARLEQAGVVRQTSAGRRNRAWESVGLFDLLDSFERDLGPAGRTPIRRSPEPSTRPFSTTSL